MNAGMILQFQQAAVPSRRDSDEVSVAGLDWTVCAGDFWVLGGHGPGRNDLLFMLAGMTRPLAGQCTLFNRDLMRHSGDEFLSHRLRAALVFDDARLFNDMTLAENVALPLRYHRGLDATTAAPRVTDLLAATGLESMSGEHPGAVPRAWRRRAALARALALGPDLLLLENALRGFDSRHTAWWMEFIGALRRGHPVVDGRPVTVVITADESTPWHGTGAQFATVRDGGFFAGEEAAAELMNSKGD
jgi:ABC-type transporter Mla maintaining outer membrane lipid asymmetry ATPase subunit MlaF